VNTFAGWAIFDDSNVRYVSETDVLKQQGYILFYQKRDDTATKFTQVFHCDIFLEKNKLIMVVQESADKCSSQTLKPAADTFSIAQVLFTYMTVHP